MSNDVDGAALQDLLPRRHTNSRAHPRFTVYQDVYLEVLQCFGYRQAAHPKVFRQLASGQGSSERILTAKDFIAYQLVRPF